VGSECVGEERYRKYMKAEKETGTNFTN